MNTNLVRIPLSIYIHFPWCVRKCPYCDFNSYRVENDLSELSYINAVIADLRRDLPFLQGRKVQSIYLGGGTPSLFSPNSIEKLLIEINKLLPFEEKAEITIEANPGTFNLQKILNYKYVGINRVSVGVQSFHDEQLQTLQRIHTASQTYKAIDYLIQAGFTNFNLDLMHGLPNQTVEEAMQDLETALFFQPPHISWYELTIEPGTAFHAAPPKLPNEETLLHIQEAGQELLANHGYQHYEISAFCQPDHECQHNLNYWHFGDYLGIGAGAHGKITLFSPSFQDIFHNKEIDEAHIIQRYSKIKKPDQYLSCLYLNKNAEDSFYKAKTIIPKHFLASEFMLNALRLMNGVPTELFMERTGLPLSAIESQLQAAHDAGFIEPFQETLKTTVHGQRFLNQCLAYFV